MMKFKGYTDPWGSFVDVKINAPDLLKKEIVKSRRGTVFISSVCDGWQPLEEEFRLTRKCLEILKDHGFPVRVLTKSSLIIRDMNILSGYRNCEIGVTITTLNDSVRKDFEPQASSVFDRIGVLKESKSAGLKTYLFFGPLLPGISDSKDEIDSMVELVKKIGVDFFFVDIMNPHWQIWSSMKGVLLNRYPHAVDNMRDVLYNINIRRFYAMRIKAVFREKCIHYDLNKKVIFCF